ncbi:MAG TPA: YoaK family protein [Xanthobacteraceae bacterium]|nr:YoaK family protein [Xanthobacteraceae bacterium]
MISTVPPMPRRISVLLSVLAGYVDSCTFLALFGLFVAQVTGSFVFTGTLLVAPEEGALIKLLGIPVFFVACVITVVIVRSAAQRGHFAVAAALALETLLLAGLFACWLLAAPFRGPDAVPAVLASVFGLSAMGVQSALVRLLSAGGPSTNVMTTNTTQFAIDATEVAMSWWSRRRAPGDAAAAAAHARARKQFAGMWPVVLGFLVGTVSGALAYARFDLWAILAPIALAAALTVWAAFRVRLPSA